MINALIDEPILGEGFDKAENEPIRGSGLSVEKDQANLKAVDSRALFRGEHCGGQFFSKLTSFMQADTRLVIPFTDRHTVNR